LQGVFIAIVDCRYEQTTWFDTETLMEAVLYDYFWQMFIMLVTAGLAEQVFASAIENTLPAESFFFGMIVLFLCVF
jgi:hypothetical protein